MDKGGIVACNLTWQPEKRIIPGVGPSANGSSQKQFMSQNGGFSSVVFEKIRMQVRKEGVKAMENLLWQIVTLNPKI